MLSVGIALLGAVAGALQLPTSAGALSRRAILGGAAAAVLTPSASLADASLDALEDLPPKAKQAYLQYLPQLQLDSDYFVFELLPMLSQPGRWDRITDLTSSTDIGSAASVSRLDREFITPMRILSLSFPPDMGGDDMQTDIDKFQTAMYSMSRQAKLGATTGNVAGPSNKEVVAIYGTYDNARLALNSFFKTVNEATASKRLVALPAKGEEDRYPRSKTLYTQLLKDAALCRNRGGEQLAGIWSNLMVYGTVPGVNPCGNAAEKYYSQGL